MISKKIICLVLTVLQCIYYIRETECSVMLKALKPTESDSYLQALIASKATDPKYSSKKNIQ